jgi:hypothetical protein
MNNFRFDGYERKIEVLGLEYNATQDDALLALQQWRR